MIKWLTGAAYAALVIGTAVSALNLFGLLADLRDEARTARETSPDDIVWEAVQYRFELLALIDALERYRDGDPRTPAEEVVNRFDVFWSRLHSTSKGELGRFYARLKGATRLVSNARATLNALDPVIASLGQPDPSTLRAAVTTLRELVPGLRDISLAALAARRDLYAARAERQQARAGRTLYLLAGMLVFGSGVAILLLFERARTNSLRRDLDLKFRDSTAQLRDSEQRYRLLTAHAPEAVVVLDPARRRFVEANDNAVRLFGHSREKLLDLRPDIVSPPVQPDGRWSEVAANAYITRAMAGETPTFEWVHRNVHGQDILCEVRLVSLPAGRSTLVRGSIVDITARRRTETELARYREDLEHVVEERTEKLLATQRELVSKERLAAIGELTGTVSHELRNPLGTIATNFALLRARLKDGGESVERPLSRIERSIDRCVLIIEELLDYARMQDPAPSTVGVDPWLAGLLDELDVPADVVLVRSLDAATRASFDPDRLRQAVFNLVQNAIQAIVEREDRDAKGEVRVSTARIDDSLEIRIADTGPGVAEDLRERIFDPLFSTRSFGVGLGLPLVRRVVEQHGGSVTLETTQIGAAFTIRLPLALDRDATR